MPIELDRKEGNYGSGKGGKKKYKTTKKSYYECDLFEKIVHEEIIKDKSGTFFYLTSDFYGIGVWNKRIFFTDISNFVRAEVFFPINGNIPLVLGVITTGQKYYRLSELKNFPNLKDISTKKSYSHNQLLDKLIEENNKQNKVITYRIDKKSVGDKSYDGVEVKSLEHPSFDKYKHTPKAGFNDRISYVLYIGRSLILDQNREGENEKIISDLKDKKFCEILVFYFKLSNTRETNPPKYLELKEKKGQDCDNHNTYYLERSDHVGVSWTRIEDPKLEDVITYLIDKRPSDSEKYNNSVDVKKSTNDSFEFYTHKPYHEYADKKGYLRFNDKNLELVQNDHLGAETTRLDKFNGHTYCSVILYYYNATGQNQKPAFLELIEKNGTGDCALENQGSTSKSKCYLFQIADTEGVKWTQTEYQDLKNSTIFRLECKGEDTDGYEKSVVSNGSEKSFDVYTHKPIDSTKFGMLLFNWTILTLQPNDELPSGTTNIGKIQGKKYCKVCVYYGKSHSTEPPLYLELVESTTSDCSSGSDTSSSNEYWLQRIDPNGHHWKQKEKTENLSSKNPQDVILEIKNYKDSLMIRLTEKYEYRMSIIKNYRTDGVGEKTNLNSYISIYNKTLKNSSYQYYEHDFSESKSLKNYNIERLRLFIGNTEIKIYGNSGQLVKLYYNPLEDTEKKIQVFFYTGDSVPLMLIWNNNPYTANKTYYFTKWKQIRDLIAPNPSDQDSSRKIKSELDKINKQFNEILLNKTDPQGYGISAPPSGQPPSALSTIRVTVIKESSQEKYHKITHSTKNKSYIGNVMFKEQELTDHIGTKLSQALSQEPELKSASVISVLAYYHRIDSGYTKPLLLGFVKTGFRNNPEVFYERQSVDDNSRWAKIQEITYLRGDTGIAQRVDKIRYTIGKSFKIRMDEKPDESGSEKYQVQLVPNTNGGRDPEQVGSDQITVTKNVSTTTQPTDYTCFTHTIPPLTGSEDTGNIHYISGLQLYICQKHYLLTNVPIYYDPNKSEVKVYFYGNSGTSSDPPLDKVPLLVEYNGNHYKPSSRDGYFKIWDKVEVSASDHVTTVRHKTLQQVLDEINKDLNTIELDTTGITGGYKYGIKHHDSKAKNCVSDTMIDEFCNRVSVEHADNNYYKKLIHSTMNKGPIGSVFLSGKKIDGFNSPRLAAKCNKVEVYYHTSDSSYTKPLLIHITYQKNDIFCNNWYYRWNLDGTQWKHDTPRKYSSEVIIRDQLNQINATMSNFLYIQIGKQEQYEILAKSGSETEGREHKAEIKIDKHNACFYNPGNYRCFKHQMADYYTKNKNAIKSALQTQDQPTLELKVTLVGYILILESSDGSSLPIQLTYGTSEETSDINPYVYFFEPSGQTDKIPLLFMFSKKCFVPESKENYFSKWKQVVIDFVKRGKGLDPEEKVKIELNRITRMLNVINLDTISDSSYGDFEPPGGRSRNSLDAEKRVTVRRHMENVQEYHAVTHSTAKTGCVGTVKYGDHELKIVDQGAPKKWSEAIETELNYKTKADIYNELTAYYHKSDSNCSIPLLIKISGSSGGSHVRVQDFYYERAEKDDNLKWKKVTLEGLRKSTHDGGLTDRINKIFYGFNPNLEKPLGQSPSDNQYDMNVVQNGQETPGSDPQTGQTTSSPAADNLSTSRIPSQQHTVSTDNSIEQLPGQGVPGEYVKQQQQESQVPEARGHATGLTDQKTTPVEGPNGSIGDTSVGRSGDPVSQGTGLTPGAPKAPGLDGNGRGPGQELGSSSMSGEAGGSVVDNGAEDVFQKIVNYAKQQPDIVYGSTGSVAGVGVMATVGGVVYKKCIVGSAVAAGKAAAKVAASAASGIGLTPDQE
ncbi:hypothetical protein MACK_002226 [Theileria orientalis]|uniref:Uncharacterized protein n=1 Tax=Theileria orientalis TaxID=68886 RepID=A0A976MBB6_THEOR|nr:hypothetical protein MACK_002226 [Theileria orientalis]